MQTFEALPLWKATEPQQPHVSPTLTPPSFGEASKVA